MTLQVHLNKSGANTMGAKTACGRNILRTPMATDWEGFKTEFNQCEKCVTSKLFAFLTRKDVDSWVPVEDPDAWKKADDALMASRKK